MRRLLIAGLGVALVFGGVAEAQRGRGPGYSRPGRGHAIDLPKAPDVGVGRGFGHGLDRRRDHGGWRKRDGRWVGGWNAPGGWDGYRRPQRGWALPPYWVQPLFGIADWAGYGLAAPPDGYNWSRYYDDAVLIDDRGSVYDTVGGVDWDGDDDRRPVPSRPASSGSVTTVTAGGGYDTGSSVVVVGAPDGSVVTTTSGIGGDRAGPPRRAPGRMAGPR